MTSITGTSSDSGSHGSPSGLACSISWSTLRERSPRSGTTADAEGLFILGKTPQQGGAAILDHQGAQLMTSSVDAFPGLVDLLCEDLVSQPQFDVGLRGVGVAFEDSVMVMDERMRPSLEAAADRAGSDRAPAPLHVLGVRAGSDGLAVTVRGSEHPFDHHSVPLAGIRAIDPVTGPASAVTICATLLTDPTDLPQRDGLWIGWRSINRQSTTAGPAGTAVAVLLISSGLVA